MANLYIQVPSGGSSSPPGSAIWGDITGILSDQTDLQSALNLKAPLASPTFTGTVTTPLLIVSGLTASTVPFLDASKQLASSAVTPTELGYLSGVTSALQTQLNAKAPLASPTFTGTVTTPALNLSGATASLPIVTDASKNLVSLSYSSFTANLSTFVGDSGSGGTKGLVPAPAAGDAAAGKFLSAAGTFSVPTGSGISGSWSSTGNVVTTNGTNAAADSGTTLASLAPKANPTFTGTVITGNSLHAADDAVNNASPAQNLTVKAGSKTAGTGNGGDLQLDSGSSSGGNNGNIRFFIDGVENATLDKDGLFTTLMNGTNTQFVERTTGILRIGKSGAGRIDFYTSINFLLPYSSIGADTDNLRDIGCDSGGDPNAGNRFRTGSFGTNVLAYSGYKTGEGTNKTMGKSTLVGGTVTVSTTKVTANSRIFLTSQADGGTVGFLRVSTRTAGTSFVITSSSVLDTSDVAWQIFEPAP